MRKGNELTSQERLERILISLTDAEYETGEITEAFDEVDTPNVDAAIERAVHIGSMLGQLRYISEARG